MTERITPQQFHEADGVDDWRVLAHGACGHFRTASFAAGVALVDAIGRLADTANHHPDVDLRYAGVTVRLISHDVHGLSERDVELARQISAAARKLDIPADPTVVQDIDFTIDSLVRRDVMPFWRAVLGYRQEGDEDLLDPQWRWPTIWFQQMDEPRPQRTGSTSTSGCLTIRRRRASRPQSLPVVTSSVTSTRPRGGPWLTPRATRPTSPPGWAATERTRRDQRLGRARLGSRRLSTYSLWMTNSDGTGLKVSRRSPWR
jgi:4a-hydroxytetrahydrobiopterin dehydratase